jgi:hypothetical protein
MNVKRIVLVSLLFFILVFSFLYFAFPNTLFPLRMDDVPPDANIVPWMRPNPQITELSSRFDINLVMANALKLNITFSIVLFNGTRVIPSTLYLGHDSSYLYVGGRFVGMYTNPINTDNDTYPEYFSIYFDVPNNGVLSSPESGSRIALFIQKSSAGGLSWFYHDLSWVYDTSVTHRMIWMTANDYYAFCLHRAQPTFSLAAEAAEYDKTTGTVSILFARFLSRAEISEANALQMRLSERWVLGFQLELGFTNPNISPEDLFLDFIDGWPRNTYPYLSNDSSWWPKMVIDLTNPPSTYLGDMQPATFSNT